jgi:hypothetical protein|tara:strand:- start:1869 stop:2732 length:864 start_codon:yes stop_codon:yes gene_type:complete
MAHFNTTTGAVFIPEIWSEAIFKYFEAKLKLRGSVDDYSALVASSGDTINIPKIAMDGTNDKSVNTEVTYSISGTETSVALAINKHKYLANIFEDMALIQSSPELLTKYTQMMGESLARGVEDDIWSELDGFQTGVDLAADNRVQADDLENILNTLYSQDIDPNTCSFTVNNEILSDMLNPSGGIAQYFIRQDAVGDGTGLKTGAVGLIYGMDVFYSRAIASSGTDGTKVGAVYPKEACAFAAQQDVRVQSQYDVGFLGTKVVADMIYGVKLVDESGHLMGLNIVNP